MSSCPCKRRKNGSLLITCSQNCEFKTWHTECAGFNNIVNKKQVEEIGAWNCPCCAVRALQIPGYYKGTVKHDLIEKMEEKLDGLHNEINELKEIKQGFADLKEQNKECTKLWSEVVATGSNNEKTFVSSVAKEVIHQSSKISSERESREKNIIVFNICESTDENLEQRKAHDQKVFEKLCRHVVNDVFSTDKIVRIGRKSKNTSSVIENPTESAKAEKSRPIKVCFNNLFDKRKFMANLYKLKECTEDLKEVRVQHDLAPDDRAVTKSLLTEAYEKNQTETPQGFLYKVRGPPHAPKIVKIYLKK